MKKVFVMLLTVAMLMSFAACTVTPDTTSGDPSGDNTTVNPSGDNTTVDPSNIPNVMTHDQYIAAEKDSEVIIEAYVQAKQGWWEKDGVGGVVTVYLQEPNGAYLAYDMSCSEADAAKLTAGTKIRVSGYKGDYEGEIEIVNATFEFVEAEPWIAEAKDVTALLGTDELIDHQNEFVSFKNAKIVASKVTGDDTEHVFLYKWNGTGTRGDDLYFNVEVDGKTYTFTVESYLCGADTEVYKAVEEMQIGDVVDLEGFLYWYNGVNPHITSVKKAA